MKFHTLEVNNFLTITNARISLDDRGLHVIQGRNDMDSSADSNGAGKSSLTDALSWVIYGITARGVKGDSVVNLASKKNTEVSLILSNGASVYKVTRYRKHKEHKNALHLHLMGKTHGETAVLTKGTDAETQKELERIIGCSQEVFLASVYAGQEAMPDLPGMTDRELKRLVEEAAGLERIERAYQEARIRLQGSAGTCQNLQFRFEEVQRQVANLAGNIEHQDTERTRWDAERATKIAAYESQVSEAQRQLAEAQAAADAGVAKRGALATLEAELRASLGAHKSAHDAMTNAQQEVYRTEASLRTMQAQRQTMTNQRQKLDSELIAIESGAYDTAQCATCGSLPDPSKVATHREHMLRSKIGQIEALAAQIVTLETQMRTTLDELRSRRAAAEAAAAAVPDVSATTAKLAKITDALAKITGMEAAAQGAKNALSMAEGNLANYKAQENPHVRQLERLRDLLTQEQKRLQETLEAHKKELERHRVLEAVVQLYGPAGVRAHILDTVTPYLNERTADYLATISDGAITATWSTLSRTSAGAVREKFSIEVAHTHGGDSFAAISGGEKRKVRLACALALQDLVASRATQPLDLFVGDEIDDALDKAGLERLMTILERKARERGTVLVISHNDLSDWADQITTVTKVAPRQSTVSGSLCV